MITEFILFKSSIVMKLMKRPLRMNVHLQDLRNRSPKKMQGRLTELLIKDDSDDD